MKIQNLVLVAMASMSSALADTCPIAELEGQRFRRTGLVCSEGDSVSCAWLEKDFKVVGIMQTSFPQKAYIVAHTKEADLLGSDWGGFGFGPNSESRDGSFCGKSINEDGSVTYRFLVTVCWPCKIQEFVVTGNKAFYRVGSELSPSIATFERY